MYKGKTISKTHNVTSWQTCQEHCKLFLQNSPNIVGKGRIVFMYNEADNNSCKCRTGKLKRLFSSSGTISGPLVCNAAEYQEPTQEEEDKHDMANVPMQELSACEKSPPVKNIEELQEKYPLWMQQCYTNASKVVTTNFNPFYKRFAKFVDRLAWKAGCGLHPDIADTEDYTEISDQFDFQTFSECDWSRLAERPENDAWMPDRERARGWTGTSKISLEEQWQLRMQFPLPAWLERRRKMLTCLKVVADNGQIQDEDPELGGAEAGMLNAITGLINEKVPPPQEPELTQVPPEFSELDSSLESKPAPTSPTKASIMDGLEKLDSDLDDVESEDIEDSVIGGTDSGKEEPMRSARSAE